MIMILMITVATIAEIAVLMIITGKDFSARRTPVAESYFRKALGNLSNKGLFHISFSENCLEKFGAAILQNTSEFCSWK